MKINKNLKVKVQRENEKNRDETIEKICYKFLAREREIERERESGWPSEIRHSFKSVSRIQTKRKGE